MPDALAKVPSPHLKPADLLPVQQDAIVPITIAPNDP